MKVEIFKKGTKVRVIYDSANASDFTQKLSGIPHKGVYSFDHWKDKVFVIEGEIQLYVNKHFDKAFCAYLLEYEGKKVGYVYNYALVKAMPHESVEVGEVYYVPKYGGLIHVKHVDQKLITIGGCCKYYNDCMTNITRNVVTNDFFKDLILINDIPTSLKISKSTGTYCVKDVDDNTHLFYNDSRILKKWEEDSNLIRTRNV
jgi:hypothetical protein